MDLVSPLDIDELKNKGETFFERPLEDGDEPVIPDEANIDIFCQEFIKDNDINPDVANPYNFEEIKDRCENLTPDGGVKKLLIKRGTGPIVPPRSNVTIMYSAYTEFDDSPFDVTFRPTHMDIGMSTLKGFSIALASMRKGEKASFYLAPNYAYGKLGCPKRIPPNATCLFIIELMDYLEEGGVGEYYDEPPVERHDVPYDVMISVVKKKKKDAKSCFMRKDYCKARKMYEKSVSDLSKYDMDVVTDKLDHKLLLVSLNSNAAICCLKLCEYTPCIKFADAALKLDDRYVKAIFAKGKALHKSGDFEGALKLLLEAKTLNPKNKDINEELLYLDRYVEKVKIKEQLLCNKIMRSMNLTETDISDVKQKEDDEKQLDEEVKKVFVEKLNSLKASQESDLSRTLTLNWDTFDSEELQIMAKIAKSMDFKVHTRTDKNNALDKIVISNL